VYFETRPLGASLLSQLHAATLYWQFPDIAWMKLFPRIESATRATVSNRGESQPVPSLTSLGGGLVNAINSQWYGEVGVVI
jgi:hypothetical protein